MEPRLTRCATVLGEGGNAVCIDSPFSVVGSGDQMAAGN
jgi:hypothetical protein